MLDGGAQQVPSPESVSGDWKGDGHLHGYVIDHVIPLKRGGPDAPTNMQWQTVSEAKEKDRRE